MREIEQDGFITREEDISPRRQTCFNCDHYTYSLFLKCYVCSEGHSVSEKKYNVCDEWRRKR